MYLLFKCYFVWLRLLVWLVPFKWCQRFHQALAYLFLPLLGNRRAIMHQNLSLVYSDLSHEARERRIKRNLNDFLMMPYYMALSFYGSQKRIDVIEKKGFEIVKDWVNQGERIIGVVPHWHALEMVCRLVDGTFKGRVSVIKRDMDNQRLDHYIVSRRNAYARSISRHDVKSIYKHLKQPGSILGVLPDQYYEKGPKTTFMGVETRRTDSVARMANRFKAKVVFAHIYLQADQQCITLEPLKEPLTGDIAKDHQAIFDQMGDLVLTNPDHYLWFHHMFKNRRLNAKKVDA